MQYYQYKSYKINYSTFRILIIIKLQNIDPEGFGNRGN